MVDDILIFSVVWTGGKMVVVVVTAPELTVVVMGGKVISVELMTGGKTIVQGY